MLDKQDFFRVLIEKGIKNICFDCLDKENKDITPFLFTKEVLSKVGK